jgi:hypothetical protein
MGGRACPIMTCEVTYPNKAKTTNNPAAFKIGAPMQNIPFMTDRRTFCPVPKSLLCCSSQDGYLLLLWSKALKSFSDSPLR